MNLRLAAGGAAMLAAAAYVQERARQAERANRPRGRFLELDGARVHYVERGEGPPLVVLHGVTGLDDFVLGGLIARASAHYRVIALDRPGYGHSTRPRGRLWTPGAQAALLSKLLHKLDVDWPIILGHYSGTSVALSFALNYPAEVRSLVLLSGCYYPTLRPELGLLASPTLPLVGDLLRHTVTPLIGRALWPLWLQLMFAPAPVPAYYFDFPAWMALRPSQLRALAQDSVLQLPFLRAMRKRYASLKVPALLVAGADDRYVSPRHSLQLCRQLPAGKLMLIPGAGHMVHHMAAAQVTQAVDEAASL